MTPISNTTNRVGAYMETKKLIMLNDEKSDCSTRLRRCAYGGIVKDTRNKIIFITLGLLLLFSDLCLAHVPPEVGKPAPKIEISDWINGRIEGDNPLAGKTIILDFWATWCGPCVRALPHMDSLVEKFSNPNTVFLAITDEKRADVDKFLQKRPMKSIVVLDRNGKTVMNYGDIVRGYTFLIDIRGILRWYGSAATLTGDILDRFLKNDTVPMVTERLSDEHTFQISKNSIYSLTIGRSTQESVRRTYQYSGAYTLEIEFDRYPVVELLVEALHLGKPRLIVRGKAPEDTLDVTLASIVPMKPKAARSLLTESLCKMYGISIAEVDTPLPCWSIPCPQTALTPSLDSSGSIHTTKGRWYGKGITLGALAKNLGLQFHQTVFSDCTIDRSYDIEFSTRDIESAIVDLKKNYGIVLEKTMRNVKVTVVSFGEDVKDQ